MSKAVEQVWQDFMGSMHQGNDHWQDLVADDIEFNGPVQQVTGKDDFIKLNQGFFQMVTGFDIHRHTCADNTVATEATIKLKSPDGNEIAFDMAEFYKIENGKIQSVKIYYDPREFLQEFSTYCN
ncbi:MAG: nuclear transport factor 2 family protein [Gammaproteobacteria bacterium]|nr:nuclear transport factor 2 family protein [Gammaproteobacteria bacterium]